MARETVSGDDNILHLPAIIECPECDFEFEHIFTAEAIDIEQLKDPPEAEVSCEQCQHKWTAVYPGFIQYGYA